MRILEIMLYIDGGLSSERKRKEKLSGEVKSKVFIS